MKRAAAVSMFVFAVASVVTPDWAQSRCRVGPVGPMILRQSPTDIDESRAKQALKMVRKNVGQYATYEDAIAHGFQAGCTLLETPPEADVVITFGTPMDRARSYPCSEHLVPVLRNGTVVLIPSRPSDAALASHEQPDRPAGVSAALGQPFALFFIRHKAERNLIGAEYSLPGNTPQDKLNDAFPISVGQWFKEAPPCSNPGFNWIADDNWHLDIWFVETGERRWRTRYTYTVSPPGNVP